jgi:hypothetical protein
MRGGSSPRTNAISLSSAVRLAKWKLCATSISIYPRISTLRFVVMHIDAEAMLPDAKQNRVRQAAFVFVVLFC